MKIKTHRPAKKSSLRAKPRGKPAAKPAKAKMALFERFKPFIGIIKDGPALRILAENHKRFTPAKPEKMEIAFADAFYFIAPLNGKSTHTTMQRYRGISRTLRAPAHHHRVCSN